MGYPTLARRVRFPVAGLGFPACPWSRLYHKSRPDSTGKDAFILPLYSARAKALVFQGRRAGGKFHDFCTQNGFSAAGLRECNALVRTASRSLFDDRRATVSVDIGAADTRELCILS